MEAMTYKVYFDILVLPIMKRSWCEILVLGNVRSVRFGKLPQAQALMISLCTHGVLKSHNVLKSILFHFVKLLIMRSKITMHNVRKLLRGNHGASSSFWHVIKIIPRKVRKLSQEVMVPHHHFGTRSKWPRQSLEVVVGNHGDTSTRLATTYPTTTSVMSANLSTNSQNVATNSKKVAT